MANRSVLAAVSIGVFLLGLAVALRLPVPIRNWILWDLDSPETVFDRLSILQLAIGSLIEFAIVFVLTYAFLGLFIRGR